MNLGLARHRGKWWVADIDVKPPLRVAGPWDTFDTAERNFDVVHAFRKANPSAGPETLRFLVSTSKDKTRRRFGNAEATDRLLSGHGPYYYEHDREMHVLLDVARPHRKRKLPQPQENLVYDRTYQDLSGRGFLRWVQVHPHHQSLEDDHYELTAKGRKAIDVYKAFARRIGGRS